MLNGSPHYLNTLCGIKYKIQPSPSFQDLVVCMPLQKFGSTNVLNKNGFMVLFYTAPGTTPVAVHYIPSDKPLPDPKIQFFINFNDMYRWGTTMNNMDAQPFEAKEYSIEGNRLTTIYYP